MKRRHHGATDEADIDMTPMLDVTFIMLIFFIVTTSFVKEIGLDVNRPSNNAQKIQSEPEEVILLEINANGQILMDGRVIDVRAVEANIARAKAGMPNANVVVVVNKQADTDYMVQVLDQAKAAGAENVSIAARAE